MKVWIIIQFNERGPTAVWAFSSEEKAREYGYQLLKADPLVKYRIGSEEVL